MITIVDYKTGNLQSIANMIRKVGGEAVISDKAEDIASADKLILPGVGHFDYGMRNLKQSGLQEVLNKRVLDDKITILGICLGAQLFTKGSDEGNEPGLSWIDGKTVAFTKPMLEKGMKIPHMGWSDVTYKASSRLFGGFSETPRFYFVHSYHLVCNSAENELTHCNYGYNFVAGFEHDNIIGVQFHPEKSHRFGLQILSNFVNNY